MHRRSRYRSQSPANKRRGEPKWSLSLDSLILPWCHSSRVSARALRSATWTAYRSVLSSAVSSTRQNRPVSILHCRGKFSFIRIRYPCTGPNTRYLSAPSMYSNTTQQHTQPADIGCSSLAPHNRTVSLSLFPHNQRGTRAEARHDYGTLLTVNKHLLCVVSIHKAAQCSTANKLYANTAVP